jgi:branched-chain amino acid transport system substrate-binding protein
VFKKEIPELSVPNPFIKGGTKLQYVGAAYFSQKRQIGLPMVINSVQDGAFKTLFVGTVQ